MSLPLQGTAKLQGSDAHEFMKLFFDEKEHSMALLPAIEPVLSQPEPKHLIPPTKAADPLPARINFQRHACQSSGQVIQSIPSSSGSFHTSTPVLPPSMAGLPPHLMAVKAAAAQRQLPVTQPSLPTRPLAPKSQQNPTLTTFSPPPPPPFSPQSTMISLPNQSGPCPIQVEAQFAIQSQSAAQVAQQVQAVPQVQAAPQVQAVPKEFVVSPRPLFPFHVPLSVASSSRVDVMEKQESDKAMQAMNIKETESESQQRKTKQNSNQAALDGCCANTIMNREEEILADGKAQEAKSNFQKTVVISSNCPPARPSNSALQMPCTMCLSRRASYINPGCKHLGPCLECLAPPVLEQDSRYPKCLVCGKPTKLIKIHLS
jgi:hypothetical protein